MHTRVIGVAVGTASLLALWSGSARADFLSIAQANATTLIEQRDTERTAMTNVEAELESVRGAHGYAMVDTDFSAGIFRGRNHGCVGGFSAFQDRASGRSTARATSEEFTVRSSTLPANTPVSVTLCYSYTSDIGGTATYVGGASGNGSSNSLVILSSTRSPDVTTQIINGIVKDTNSWTSFSGTGDFAGQTSSSFTVADSFIVQTKVGGRFDVTLLMESLTAS